MRLKVYHDKRPVAQTDIPSHPLILGRQDRDEPEPYALFNLLSDKSGPKSKLVIAEQSETSIPRRQVCVELLDNDTVRVTNLHKLTFSVDGSELSLDESRIVASGALLAIGNRACRIESTFEAPPPGDLHSLAQPTIAPGKFSLSGRTLADLMGDSGTERMARLVRSLQSVVDVLNSAATNSDFFDRATENAAAMLGLDGVKVFTRDAGTGWKQASSRPKDFDHSDTILDKVLAERRTFRLVPEHDLGSGRPVSLDNVKSVVAAPILDRDGEVIGALYGDRRTVRENRLEITEIEAVLAEMVACGIAAGIARVNEEQDALKARAQFESFFTPELARQLELEPDLLDGREAEITVMFCDVRGFSRISHRIGPRETVAWTSDVMARLSDCVSAHGGVLVDYIGDELMAMWGAPQQTPRHAELACRAGLEMLRTLPEINRLWKERIGDATAIGIGVNSGKAFVGNTGSHRKFKYGPLGNTVNLASRVQGATRQVNSAMLITDMTHTALTGQQSGGDLRTRRLCQARVVNISEPVQLYEVDAGDRPRWDELRTLYEEALAMFEAGDFAKSARILGNLMADHPEDGPTLRLLARAVNALATGPDPSHPVWEFDSK